MPLHPAPSLLTLLHTCTMIVHILGRQKKLLFGELVYREQLVEKRGHYEKSQWTKCIPGIWLQQLLCHGPSPTAELSCCLLLVVHTAQPAWSAPLPERAQLVQNWLLQAELSQETASQCLHWQCNHLSSKDTLLGALSFIELYLA